MRYPELILVKVSKEMAAAIRKRAMQDDRTVSGFVRHLVAKELAAQQASADGR